MSNPVKRAALGVALWIGDAGSPETFFKVGSIKDVAGPKIKKTTIDVTTHDSLSGYNEFIASLKDGQEVTFPIELDPTSNQHDETPTVIGQNAGGLKYLLEDVNIPRNMKLVIPSSPLTRFSFAGLVTGYEPDLKVLGSIMANITIKVSGKPGLAVGDQTS